MQADGSARPHCPCDMRRHSGTVARARQVRGVRHCKSLAALNAPRVYVGAVRQRFGRTHGPALVCPDRSTGPDFCTGQLFLLSLRELVRRVARSAHVQRGQLVSFVLREQVRLFARVFHGQVFRSSGRGVNSCAKNVRERRKVCPFAHAQHGQKLPILPTFAHGLPIFHGQLFSLDIPGG